MLYSNLLTRKSAIFSIFFSVALASPARQNTPLGNATAMAAPAGDADMASVPAGDAVKPEIPAGGAMKAAVPDSPAWTSQSTCQGVGASVIPAVGSRRKTGAAKHGSTAAHRRDLFSDGMDDLLYEREEYSLPAGLDSSAQSGPGAGSTASKRSTDSTGSMDLTDSTDSTDSTGLKDSTGSRHSKGSTDSTDSTDSTGSKDSTGSMDSKGSTDLTGSMDSTDSTGLKNLTGLMYSKGSTDSTDSTGSKDLTGSMDLNGLTDSTGSMDSTDSTGLKHSTGSKGTHNTIVKSGGSIRVQPNSTFCGYLSGVGMQTDMFTLDPGTYQLTWQNVTGDGQVSINQAKAGADSVWAPQDTEVPAKWPTVKVSSDDDVQYQVVYYGEYATNGLNWFMTQVA
ncbi:hypothetical protein MMC18_005031 [Xylographa bjoerkii]|nr:hypothetical protein [Xylographa bjoerkii]